MQDRNRRLEAFQRSRLGPRQVTTPVGKAEWDNKQPAVRTAQIVKLGEADRLAYQGAAFGSRESI
jgi:hypothetical protein